MAIMFGLSRGTVSFILSTLLIQLVAAVGEGQRRAVKAADDSGSDEGPPYTVCDADCQRQVKYLEAFILAVVCTMALVVGLCCMHMVDTPTKFASPKETRTHQE